LIKLAILLAAGTAAAPPADWRVAAMARDATVITFVDAASIVHTGDKVSFRMDQRRPLPLVPNTMVVDVEADCASRSWTGKRSGQERVNGKDTTFTETTTTVARPGTVYDAVLTAACTGKFRSDAVADPARHAADYFAESRKLEEARNRFESETAGFSLTKPANWTFAPVDQETRARTNARVFLSDEESRKLFERHTVAPAATPLVAIKKHKEPFAGLNPSLQVSYRPLEPHLPPPSPKEILEGSLSTLRKALPDLVLESPVKEFKFAGHEAAEYVATGTLRTKDGGAFPMRIRMIFVVGGKSIFFIAMASSPEGDDGSGDAFASILSSITIGA
jgi:hypothetical protein